MRREPSRVEIPAEFLPAMEVKEGVGIKVATAVGEPSQVEIDGLMSPRSEYESRFCEVPPNPAWSPVSRFRQAVLLTLAPV